MKEFDIDYGSFIGGWYIPENICDNLINLFHSEKNDWIDGSKLNKKVDHKKSTELAPSRSHSEMENYIDYLYVILQLYKKRYPYSDKVDSYDIIEDIKIQHYKPGEGFYGWHTENDGYSSCRARHLVFMTYLNTLDNAGTEFFHQKITTPCQKGLTVIWPATWTHYHRGVTNHDSDKYIITGWMHFPFNFQVK